MASVFRKKKKEPLFDSGPEAFNLLMKEAVVREFLDEQEAEVIFVRCLPDITENSANNPSRAASTAERRTGFCYGTTQNLGARHKRASKIWRDI